jgi:CheY-like chemotaxis protein
VRLLIVDDLEENLVAHEVLLRRPGREISCVRSGAEAIEQFMRTPTALVLLDVMMPKMNGIETAEALRALDPSLPIVFVSAAADETNIQYAARRLGALGCILIPVDAEVLTKMVADVEALHEP